MNSRVRNAISTHLSRVPDDVTGIEKTTADISSVEDASLRITSRPRNDTKLRLYFDARIPKASSFTGQRLGYPEMMSDFDGSVVSQLPKQIEQEFEEVADYSIGLSLTYHHDQSIPTVIAVYRGIADVVFKNGEIDAVWVQLRPPEQEKD